MFTIEKGIPLPPPLPDEDRSMPEPCPYPFAQMEIGDSLFVETATRYAASVASQYGRVVGRKFISRKGAGGYRIWRIA